MPDYLIVRLSSLGDIIHTLPAFAELRKNRPDSRISWVVDPPGKTILDLVSGIDRIIVRGEHGWLRALRDKNRIAIDFQGLLKSAVIARLSGARERIGFSGRNLREPAAACFYTSHLTEITEDRHVIRKNLDLLEAAGLKIEAGKWDFPIVLPEALRQSVRTSLGALGLEAGQDLVLCNVGGRVGEQEMGSGTLERASSPHQGRAPLLPPSLGKGGGKADGPKDSSRNRRHPRSFLFHPGGSSTSR